jgi:LysR family glycine cleavage system transcriptional activator
LWLRPDAATIDSFSSITEIFYPMDAFPPLKALVAFDAAMQHQSFTIAAQALSVTPGAIGQQIQNLEAWLGTALFVRTVRQVTPTASALRYWADVQPALASIHAASHALRRGRRDDVKLSMPPTFAAKWFARRMGRFMALHPQIVLHLGASTDLADFAHQGADLAIRYFDGKDAGLDVALLSDDEARLYCSPGYAASMALALPDDLVRATLLHTTMHPHWPAWLEAFSKLTAAQVAAIPVQHLDLSLIGIEAARRGEGVVLTSALLVEDELEKGSLIEPFAARLPLTVGYYVVHPRGVALHPAAQHVAQWLLSAE